MSAILKSFALTLPTLFFVATFTFLMIHLLPGDPVDMMLGEQAIPSQKQELREQLGLNLPLSTQYRHYLVNLLQGNLGVSIQTHEPVSHRLREKLPATFALTACATLFALLLALPLGVFAASYANRWPDRLVLCFSLAGTSMPNFWLGPMLVLLFAYHANWFPVSGQSGWSSLILPSCTLSLGMAAILSRMTRAALLETLHEDFMRTAMAKGASRRRLFWKHGFRNAMCPIVTIAGLQIGSLLAGTVITESVFSWPGIGMELVTAIHGRDYPVVQGCVLFIALSYVLVHLVVDLLYAWMDPRARRSLQAC